MIARIALLSFCMVGGTLARAATPATVHTYFKQVDADHDGRIILAEFSNHEKRVRSPQVTPALLRTTFQEYDLNGDGFVTEVEMQKINDRANTAARAHPIDGKR